MKKLLTGLAGLSLALGTAQASAEDLGGGLDISMNAGVVSNYLWRGVSQSRDHAAIQGGIDLKHSSGAYAGTWLSSAKFELVPDVYLEQDIYAGYGFTAGDFAFDVRYTEYHYPSISAVDFSEWHAHVSAYGVTIGADYSADTPIVDTDSTFHYYGSYSYTLPQDVGLTATIGEYDFKDAGWTGGMDSKYTYYSVGVSKAYAGVTWGLAYSGTNMDDDNCAVFVGDEDYCDGSVVLSATKAM